MAKKSGAGSGAQPVQEQGYFDSLKDLGLALTDWTMRYVPEPWVIAVILSVIIFLMTMIWGGVTVTGAVGAWGKGFWTMLTFMAQFAFAIMVAYACAAAPVMSRFFDYLSSRSNPDKPWQAVLLMAVFSLFTAWLNWAVSITMSAMFAPYLAKNNGKTDFRLVVAAAYIGFATMWASGLSSTAPLLLATPDNFVLKAGIIKEIIPVTHTIITPINFFILLVSCVVMCVMFVLITPRPEKAYTLTKEQAGKLIRVATVKPPAHPTFAQRLNWWPGWSIMLILACITYMIISFKQIGAGAWTIDMYNLTFLIVALILNWRPAILFDGFKKGITGTWGILSQYPLYGGIFGLIVFTGLGKFLTHVFTSISTTHTFIPIIYWYSGLLSYFVPSAGAKFAMEAGYILPAGQALGVSAASVTLAYTWGDMLTHLIQPFWAIAILDITETHFGQIAGFCALLFIVYAIIMSGMIFLIPLHL